jgi:hypothetical protein
MSSLPTLRPASVQPQLQASSSSSRPWFPRTVAYILGLKWIQCVISTSIQPFQTVSASLPTVTGILTRITVPSMAGPATSSPSMSEALPGPSQISGSEPLSNDKTTLRHEFRALTSLATLGLKLLGTRGRLPKDLHDTERTPRSNGRYPHRILAAVAALLVRRFEVVAVTNYLTTKCIAAIAGEQDSCTNDKFTDNIEPQELSSYNMNRFSWISWISSVSFRYFTTIGAVVNPNDEIPGTEVDAESSNVIEIVKVTHSVTHFDASMNPLDYYTIE